MPERPTSSLSVAGGAELLPLDEDARGLLRELYRHRDNAIVAGALAIEGADFIATIRAEPWAAPMILLQDGDPVACALVAAADTQNRHGRLVLLAREPARCRVALPLYLRHVFWSHSLHRLYSILPAQLPQSHSYAALLRDSGFNLEGSLLDHVMLKGRRHDLEVFGLLRAEFDAWCQEREPGWRLQG
jgi:hypothetical protein